MQFSRNETDTVLIIKYSQYRLKMSQIFETQNVTSLIFCEIPVST